MTRPWWRHWHVDGHMPGYSRKDARDVAERDRESLGANYVIVPERCDVDHSTETIGWIGTGHGVVGPIRVTIQDAGKEQVT